MEIIYLRYPTKMNTNNWEIFILYRNRLPKNLTEHQKKWKVRRLCESLETMASSMIQIFQQNISNFKIKHQLVWLWLCICEMFDNFSPKQSIVELFSSILHKQASLSNYTVHEFPFNLKQRSSKCEEKLSLLRPSDLCTQINK